MSRTRTRSPSPHDNIRTIHVSPSLPISTNSIGMDGNHDIIPTGGSAVLTMPSSPSARMSRRQQYMNNNNNNNTNDAPSPASYHTTSPSLSSVPSSASSMIPSSLVSMKLVSSSAPATDVLIFVALPSCIFAFCFGFANALLLWLDFTNERCILLRRFIIAESALQFTLFIISLLILQHSCCSIRFPARMCSIWCIVLLIATAFGFSSFSGIWQLSGDVCSRQWLNMSIADLFVLPVVQVPVIAFLIVSLWSHYKAEEARPSTRDYDQVMTHDNHTMAT